MALRIKPWARWLAVFGAAALAYVMLTYLLLPAVWRHYEHQPGLRRHQVRFWKVLEKGIEGRPVWLGSATLDRSVGLSH
jgi:hypothetical protein